MKRIAQRNATSVIPSQTIKSLKRVLRAPDEDCFINGLGQIECKLCHTKHTSLASYQLHYNGRNHSSLSQKLQQKTKPCLCPQYSIVDIQHQHLALQGCQISFTVKNAECDYKVIDNDNTYYLLLHLKGFETIGIQLLSRYLVEYSQWQTENQFIVQFFNQ